METRKSQPRPLPIGWPLAKSYGDLFDTPCIDTPWLSIIFTKTTPHDEYCWHQVQIFGEYTSFLSTAIKFECSQDRTAISILLGLSKLKVAAEVFPGIGSWIVVY